MIFWIGVGTGLVVGLILGVVAEVARIERLISKPTPSGFARCPVTGNLYFRGD